MSASSYKPVGPGVTLELSLGHRPPVTFLGFMSLGDYFVKERLVLAGNGQAACAFGVLK